MRILVLLLAEVFAMASRTYIPTLIFIARQIIRYVTRYQGKLQERLSPEVFQLLLALLAAAQLLVNAIEEPAVGP
jgi:hypothetical protein